MFSVIRTEKNFFARKKPMSRLSVAYLAISLPILFSPALSASDGPRSVTQHEYDGLGRKIETRVYDGKTCNDSGDISWNWTHVPVHTEGTSATSESRTFSSAQCTSSGRLVALSQTDYDRYNNTIEERQFRVPYDIQTSSGVPTAVSTDKVLVHRYGYKDTTWPTKVTHTYYPRYATYPASDQESYAAQTWYDGVTGNAQLSVNSSYYCITAPFLNSPKTAATFDVDRSGSAVSVDIKNYVRCAATYIDYDDQGRPIKQQVSNALHYAQHANPLYNSRAFITTDLDYYENNTPQKGALKTATVKGYLADGGRDRITSFDWDAVGNLTSVTNALGHVSSADYDALRRVTDMYGAEGEHSVYAYDEAGRLRAISKKIDDGEWAVSKAEYYDNGQLYQLISPDNVVTAEYSYDAAGRVDEVKDGENRITKSFYYPSGQVRCAVKAYGTPLQQAYASYDYGPDGQVVRQRPAKGSTNAGTGASICDVATHDYDTIFTYDGYRRLYETTFPKRAEDVGKSYASGSILGSAYDGHTFTRSIYDAAGRVRTTRTRGGHEQRQGYDQVGNITNRYVDRWDETSASLVPESYYGFGLYAGTGHTYFSDKRPYDVSTNSYTLAHRRYIYTYNDELGNLISELNYEGNSAAGTLSPRMETSYAYDLLGRRTEIEYNDGAYATYAYDDSGRMKYAWFGASSSAPADHIASFQYDLMGRRTHHYRSSDSNNWQGAGGAPNYAVTTYAYDADSEMKTMRHWLSVSGQSAHDNSHLMSYGYDNSGLMTKQYSFNALHRYLPDVAKSQSYTGTNALDQYGSVDMDDGAGAQVQAYDGSGNLLDDGSGRSFTYDAENRLTRVTNGTTLDMEYRYDAMGRRSHAINYITGTETVFRHAGQMEIEDLEVSRDCAGGAVQCPGDVDARITSVTATHRNIIGAGMDERLAWHIRDSDTLYFPMVNHQGSTMMLVDVNGEIVTSQGDNGVFLYDEYGNTKASVALTGYPYRFTGRRLDPETELYYYRARYYDSAKGRFLQTDPIGYEDQMNLYAYVHNNPLMFTDPSGENTGQGGDLMAQGAGMLITEWQYKRRLNKLSDFQARQRTLRAGVDSMEFFGGEGAGQGLIDHEYKTRPAVLRDPNKILPTQDSFGETMTDKDGKPRGQTVDSLADDLYSGRVDPSDVEPIRIFVDENGDLRTVDHRRLIAAQRAGTQVNAIEYTIEEAQNFPGRAGDRARNNRPKEIKSRGKTIPKPRFRPR